MAGELDVKGYAALPPDLRAEIDAWLAQAGMERRLVFLIRPGDGTVTVGRYRVNAGGYRYLDEATREAAVKFVEVAEEHGPLPVAAFR